MQCIQIVCYAKTLVNSFIMMQYDTVYLTCSKKLTCSQLSLPHGTNRKIKEKRTKNKSRSMISLVQSHDCEGSPGVGEVLRWEGFVEKFRCYQYHLDCVITYLLSMRTKHI